MSYRTSVTAVAWRLRRAKLMPSARAVAPRGRLRPRARRRDCMAVVSGLPCPFSRPVRRGRGGLGKNPARFAELCPGKAAGVCYNANEVGDLAGPGPTRYE